MQNIRMILSHYAYLKSFKRNFIRMPTARGFNISTWNFCTILEFNLLKSWSRSSINTRAINLICDIIQLINQIEMTSDYLLRCFSRLIPSGSRTSTCIVYMKCVYYPLSFIQLWFLLFTLTLTRSFLLILDLRSDEAVVRTF